MSAGGRQIDIKARGPAIELVLTSGYSQVMAHEGAHGFGKPYPIERLLTALRQPQPQKNG